MSLLKSSPSPPPCLQTDKCLSSLLPQPSAVCVLRTKSSHKWKNKFNITFLLFVPRSLSPAAHLFLVFSSLTWSHLHQPPCFNQKGIDNTNLGLLPWLFPLPRIYSPTYPQGQSLTSLNLCLNALD